MQDFVKEERFLNRIGWKGLAFTKSFCITLYSFTTFESHALAFSKMSYNKSNPPLVQKDVLEGNCSVELGCPNIRCCDSWRFSRPPSCWSALFVFNLARCYPESAYFIWRESQEKEPNLIDSKDLICFATSGLYFISGFTRDSNLLQKVFFIKKWSVSGTNSFFPFLTQSFMILSLVNYKKKHFFCETYFSVAKWFWIIVIGWSWNLYFSIKLCFAASYSSGIRSGICGACWIRQSSSDVKRAK